MSLVCPKCGVSLKPLSVTKRFGCPSCGVNLEGHVTVPLIIGIMLWSIIEVLIKAFIDPKFGVFASVMGMVVGACIGFPPMLWLMRQIGTAEVRDTASPPTDL